MDIEVEILSFITKEKYNELLNYFKKEGELVSEDYQETYYFDSQEDLRIQKNNFYSKIWLKKGKMHDECREEIEIKFNRNEFEKLENLFLSLGFKIKIKWFRNRHTFNWLDIDVMVDYTKGYGYIIELEKMVGKENQGTTIEALKKKLENLEILLTSKDEFDRRFEYYEKNWQKLIGI